LGQNIKDLIGIDVGSIILGFLSVAVFVVIIGLLVDPHHSFSCRRQMCWPVDSDNAESNVKYGGYTLECDEAQWAPCMKTPKALEGPLQKDGEND
jgi:hypothetical protein